jgi:two-component sensor histidine kinase
VVLMALVSFALALGALFIKARRDINLDREAEADAAETLRELLRQRTLLLDEVNHRVKNSLQQIASVVRLQSRTAAHGETREALGKTLSRIMAVGRVHEQAYKSSEEVGHFDAGLYAQTLAVDLVGSMGRDDIALETDVETAQLELKQASPIALILNELITNALKYGCPEGQPSRLRVAFKAEPETYRLSVSDEGPGLPADFSLNGKNSLGMRAIQALARQLDGQLSVDESPVGAAFSVRFPRSIP